MKKMQLAQRRGGRKYKRVGQKVGNMVVAMQAVSVFFAVAMCIIMFRGLTTKMLKERCTNGTNMLSYVLEQTDGSGDMNQVLDELKTRMGCEFTIFEGDIRAYTTVMQDGERVVGTPLADDLAEIVLQQGQSYVGNAQILDEEYLCSYVPTKDSNGTINGLIFAGISSADASRQILLTVLVSSAVSVAVILVCIGIAAAYLKKTLSAPLAKITQAAGRLEQGDLGLAGGEDIDINIQSNDEVGDLAQIFQETVHRLRSYIGEISSTLGAISQGDLTEHVKQEYVGDFASIKQSLETIIARLNEAMGKIASSAEQVSAGADQVSTSAQTLSQGAAEQASSVEELSATVTKISENAQRTAQATREAGRFVEQASGHLGASMEYVSNLNVSMKRISDSSEEIGKIITTIEEIAFQTNILALNAAVEAARAGEAGKGFAVVADEVRNLATKSDEAAKATKNLIESSIAAINEGSHVVEVVTDSLTRTSESAGGVNAKMGIVVDAVENQTNAISQVTDGIDQISSVVQTNSATSEESAAASQELSSQASLLKALLSTFRLK